MSDGTRPYRMQRRAELEEETRTRIAASAAELHEEVGPARTTISGVAERAGVRRSTVYRHFPDEEALFAACSAHWGAANPAPDPGGWPAIADPAERTATALTEMYAYFGRTQGMWTSLLRDEPLVPVLARQLGGYHGFLRVLEDMLMAGRGLRGAAAKRTRAAIGHALAFPTFHSLTHDRGLTERDAVALMVRLVEGAAAPRR